MQAIDEKPVKKKYTPEEYLALEVKAAHKSEFYDGEIFAMAGGSESHTLISGNIHAELRGRLRQRPCRAYNSEMKILVKANGLYTYPDASVVCGKPDFPEGRTDMITNPVLIVEVLSDSTEEYDRSGKFRLYRTLGSLREYLLIEQNAASLQYYRKLEDGKWLIEEVAGMDAVLKLAHLEVEIPLSEIYDRVEFS